METNALSELEEICPIPLLILALIEARKYRWQRSQEEQHDCGEGCIVEWFRIYWRDWYRQHWIEHLNGAHFYEGFSRDEFDVLHTAQEDKALVKTLVGFLSEQGNKGENLGIICWARDFGQDFKKVIKFLRTVDINGKRFTWDAEMLRIMCLALREADKFKWIESQRAGHDLGEAAIHDWFTTYWPTWKKQHFSNFFEKVSTV